MTDGKNDRLWSMRTIHVYANSLDDYDYFMRPRGGSGARYSFVATVPSLVVAADWIEQTAPQWAIFHEKDYIIPLAEIMSSM